MNISPEQIGQSFHLAHRDEHPAQLVIKHHDEIYEYNSGCFTRDTLVNVYSISKSITSLAVFHLCNRHNIDFNRYVHEFWPTFKKAGKENITLGHLLNHTSGVAYFGKQLVTQDLYDWKKVISILENTSPLHRPGEKYVYHARTYGYLLGELVRRISGLTLGEYVKKYLCDEYMVEFYFGLKHEHELKRVIPLTDADVNSAQRDVKQSQNIESLSGNNLLLDDARISEENKPYAEQVFANPFNTILAPNERQWLKAEIPSSGGVSNAWNIVQLFSRTLQQDVHLKKQIQQSLSQKTRLGNDMALGFPVRWSHGFGGNAGEFGTGERRFGHRAIGGSIFFFDLSQELYLCYTTSKMVPQLGRHPAHDSRIIEIISQL